MCDENLPPLVCPPPGVYRHYKGHLYQVIGAARHSETRESMTLYRPLYGEPSLWVRPTAMFDETIDVGGVPTARFQRIPDASA